MKSLHDQTKRVYRTSLGWRITLWIGAAFMIFLAALPILFGGSPDDVESYASYSILFGLMGGLCVVSVEGPWLAISDYGIEVSLLFHRVYTPWDNVRTMFLNPYGFHYLYLHSPARYELWPIRISGGTRMISISSYGRKRDFLYEEIADYVNKHSTA